MSIMSTATHLIINRMPLPIDRAFAFDTRVGGFASNTKMGFSGSRSILSWYGHGHGTVRSWFVHGAQSKIKDLL